MINNNKKVLPTLLSRCINFKINLTNQECLNISNQLLGEKLEILINKDFINYYFTPGNYYSLIKFANENNYDLSELDLKNFLKILIKENYYKKNQIIKHIIYQLMEFYFRKLSQSFSLEINKKYDYFLKRVSDTKNFNLDEDSLFMQFDDEILNG